MKALVCQDGSCLSVCLLACTLYMCLHARKRAGVCKFSKVYRVQGLSPKPYILNPKP